MLSGGVTDGARERLVVYCLVPRELAAKLHEPLRRHFREDPAVEVIVEQRGRERRLAPERRSGDGSAPSRERRRIRAPEGRRVDERRAQLVPVGALVLPRRFQRHAEQLTFTERLEPAHQRLEDADTNRLVARMQSGERDLFAPLYMRYFDRVYNYLHVLVRDQHEAEDLTQGVFVKVLEGVDEYERLPGHPFRAWLFTVVRNHALSHLRKQGRADLEDPAGLDRRREESGNHASAEETPSALDWITDRDLMLFVERLPLAQRQVLVLRYLLGLSGSETAQVLGYTPNQVRKLQQRAMKFLRCRLAAVGRSPRRGDRHVRVRVRPSQAYVVRARRFMLR